MISLPDEGLELREFVRPGLADVLVFVVDDETKSLLDCWLARTKQHPCWERFDPGMPGWADLGKSAAHLSKL